MFKIARLLLLYILFSSFTQHSNNINKYNIEFSINDGIKIDFKSRVIKIDYDKLHYSDKLDLTPKEEAAIIKSFEVNRISEVKGNPIYATNEYLVMPPSGLKIKLLLDEKLKSEIFVEYSYPRRELARVSQKNRVINFRNQVLKVLDKNAQIKKAQAIFLKYKSDNNLFSL